MVYVSCTGGNAGLAVAYSGRKLSVPVTVVVPQTTPELMVQRLREETATVIVHGAVSRSTTPNFHPGGGLPHEIYGDDRGKNDF